MQKRIGDKLFVEIRNKIQMIFLRRGRFVYSAYTSKSLLRVSFHFSNRACLRAIDISTLAELPEATSPLDQRELDRPIRCSAESNTYEEHNQARKKNRSSQANH